MKFKIDDKVFLRNIKKYGKIVDIVDDTYTIKFQLIGGVSNSSSFLLNLDNEPRYARVEEHELSYDTREFDEQLKKILK